jgi:hypothetical protein
MRVGEAPSGRGTEAPRTIAQKGVGQINISAMGYRPLELGERNVEAESKTTLPRTFGFDIVQEEPRIKQG